MLANWRSEVLRAVDVWWTKQKRPGAEQGAWREIGRACRYAVTPANPDSSSASRVYGRLDRRISRRA